MPFAVRHRHDPPSVREPLPGLVVRRETNAAVVAAVQGAPEAEVARRFAAGHRAYLAWWAGLPAAWGWVATRTAEIGELGSAFEIPAGDRYLWNFVTLPAHRGKGIYPRLLDAIVQAEGREAERFWIAYAPENHASAAGIRKAGFTTVAELSFDAAGRPAVRELAEGGDAVARMLGLPLAEEALSPCWHCARKATHPDAPCRGGECTCDYQKLRSGRAA
ncbi:MAG TPA: GNAT family N-acetyltransferase [Longimicrobiaceae bacterium]|nr:GNAT family N-acetyltransferase [Longimicrobiaceae bacterium]